MMECAAVPLENTCILHDRGGSTIMEPNNQYVPFELVDKIGSDVSFADVT
jgi:hypothetical protein